MDDFRKILYGVIIGFIAIIVGWVSFNTLASCHFTLNVNNCTSFVAKGTSIPTLVPATLPAPVRFLGAAITATSAGAAQPTSASTATSSQATAARPSNPGGPGQAINLTGDPKSGSQIFATNCQICHNAQGKGGIPNPGSSDGTVPPLNPIDPTIADADYKIFATNVDLFVEHGSTPDGTSPTFSMPAWGDKKALTPQQIADVIAYVISLNPVSPSTAQTPSVGSGTATPAASAPTATVAVTSTATTAASSDVSRPSNPGGPGDAVNLTGDPNSGAQVFATNCQICHVAQGKGGNPNPGSDDGTIPALNPIDPTIKNADPKTFAYNLDLFIQHGSMPSGPGPTFSMPPWGDSGKLTQQQIADVIAYLISLNP